MVKIDLNQINPVCTCIKLVVPVHTRVQEDGSSPARIADSRLWPSMQMGPKEMHGKGTEVEDFAGKVQICRGHHLPVSWIE